VGKSNLVFRYVHGRWNGKNLSTVGVEFMSKEITVAGERFKLQIWDTAGEELFKSIAANFYKECHGVVLCFDVTSEKSFGSLEYWAKEVTNSAPKDCILMVIGTKIDLENQRTVEKERGLEFAKTHDALYFEVSSLKDGDEGVQRAFEELVAKIAKLYTEGNKKSFFEQGKSTFSKGDPMDNQVHQADCCS
jgi:small GTP-binding protein